MQPGHVPMGSIVLGVAGPVGSFPITRNTYGLFRLCLKGTRSGIQEEGEREFIGEASLDIGLLGGDSKLES